MSSVQLFVLLAIVLPASVMPFFLCTNICFDEKKICAMNHRGLMMEFKSPCYMINHNMCYGTTYETINVGPCPRQASEKHSEHMKTNLKKKIESKKTN